MTAAELAEGVRDGAFLAEIELDALTAERGGERRHHLAPRLAVRHDDLGARRAKRARSVKTDSVFPRHAEHDPAPAREQLRVGHRSPPSGNHTASEPSPSRSYSAIARCTRKAASAAGSPPIHIVRRATVSSSFAFGVPRCSNVLANMAAVSWRPSAASTARPIR